MRNPHLWSDACNKSISSNKTDQTLISVPGINKKFKRKSREPKRLYNSSSDPMGIKTYQADLDEDLAEEIHKEPCNVSTLAPVQRQLMTSQEARPSTTAILSELIDGKIKSPSAQIGAIDMRIGSNVPAITAKLSQLPVSQFSNAQTSDWPCTITQPQPNGLKLGLCSSFTPLTTANANYSHPSIHHTFSQDSSLLGEAAALSVPGASQTSQCNGHTMESQIHSPKETPRKRVGMSADLPGRLPEVKAIQQTRRLLANARERTRVHTISAAFEALRKQVPCYSYGQKLSKLAILRIACNYILSLAQLAELDYSSDHSSLSFSQCVEQCTRTLQAEGRSKKRKE
ncbi:transcription factor atoh8 [Myripristis murdjan]|uniref:transcription factor atoh8 n=1 Tax=Myripristis murdjan TaxID=586833 RepID=UPI0011762F5E|nr:protein atonal homolog 8 [Myripristis murdjan]XP_029918403.1 protein atonal homolog 8 [Myripristis murdjan]